VSDPKLVQGAGAPNTIDPLAPANRPNLPRSAGLKPGSPAGTSFSEILRARQQADSAQTANGSTSGAIRFSAHAQTRMQSRQIDLQPGQLQRLQGAVQLAAGKGARDSLVLMDNMAMVVNVPNRTVVTIVDKDSLTQNVFTNIDSAVIA
jgi:flagellar operon protein